MLTLIQTAKINMLDPEDYLCQVLQQIAANRTLPPAYDLTIRAAPEISDSILC